MPDVQDPPQGTQLGADYHALKSQIIGAAPLNMCLLKLIMLISVANAYFMAQGAKAGTFEHDANGKLKGHFEIVTSLKSGRDVIFTNVTYNRIAAILVYQQPGKETICVAQGIAYDGALRAIQNLHDVTASIVADIGDRMGFDKDCVGGLAQSSAGVAKCSILKALA
jgi:hypothetical protein